MFFGTISTPFTSFRSRRVRCWVLCYVAADAGDWSADGARCHAATDPSPDFLARHETGRSRLAIGLITAAVLVRLLRHNLAGLQVDDPALIGMAASLVAGTTAVACWVPAWRATRIDSVAAIRQE